MSASWKSIFWKLGYRIFLVVIIFFGSGSTIWLSFTRSALTQPNSTEKQKNTDSDRFRRIASDTLQANSKLIDRIGIRTAPVTTSSRGRTLAPFQGVLALDNNAFSRIRSRFAGEVMELGTTTEQIDHPFSTSRHSTKFRSLRDGDFVRQNQLLAIVWSKDLGEKKSELVDGLSKLRTDERTLDSLKDLFKEGGTSERSLREAERAVQADRIAIEKAERTLRCWRLTEEEIQKIRAEAEQIQSSKEKLHESAQWARVEIRAEQDGVLLEKNVSVGDIIDPTADLFRIGDLSQLVVWAEVYEEDLPIFQQLPKPIPWNIQIPSRPKDFFRGTFERIGSVINPNQHTALVSGHVENTDGTLKVGQFVRVTIEPPPAKDELEIPTDALIEDGKESVVFLQPKFKETTFIRCPVRVVRRTREFVYLREDSNRLKVGDWIVTSGAILLNEAIQQLPIES